MIMRVKASLFICLYIYMLEYIPEHSQQSPLEVRKDCEPRNRQQSLKMNDPLVLSPVHLSPAKQLTTV